MEKVQPQQTKLDEHLTGVTPEAGAAEEPRIVEDICVEELAIDGICGVY